MEIPIVEVDKNIKAFLNGKTIEFPLRHWVKYYYLNTKLVDQIKDKVFGEIYAIRARMPLACAIDGSKMAFACSTPEVYFGEFCDLGRKLGLPRSDPFCVDMNPNRLIAVYGTYPSYTVDILRHDELANINVGDALDVKTGLEVWRLETRIVFDYLRHAVFVLNTKWGTVYKYGGVCTTNFEEIKKLAVEDMRKKGAAERIIDAVYKFLLT